MRCTFVAAALLSFLLPANTASSASTSDALQTVTAPVQNNSGQPLDLTSSTGFVLEDATPVKLRLNRTVSSADSRVGDTVDFVVAQDINLNGTLVVRKGSLAFGTVTESQPTRRMARGGKLEINAGFVKLLDGEKVPLRAVEGGKGNSHLLAMTTGFVTAGFFFFPAAPPFLLMHGKDMMIPKGAEVTAYVNGDVKLDLARFQRPMPPVDTTSVTTSPVPQADSSPARGSFLNHNYTNQYFALSYRLPSDWVLETDLMREALVSRRQADAASLLLAAVHIPQDVTELRADSSFTLQAVARSADASTGSCKQYLDTLASSLRHSKAAKQKADVTEFTVAGHEFSRADFEYHSGTNDRAELCSPARDYLLLWKIGGSTWEAMDEAASTVYAIAPWLPEERSEQSESFTQHHISQNTAANFLLKKVQPVYPAEARENHIRGKVRMQVVIDPAGNVDVLELLNGPIELALSAVTAVRQWKYRPYLVGGQPTAVSTEIVLNYSWGPT